MVKTSHNNLYKCRIMTTPPLFQQDNNFIDLHQNLQDQTIAFLHHHSIQTNST